MEEMEPLASAKLRRADPLKSTVCYKTCDHDVADFGHNLGTFSGFGDFVGRNRQTSDSRKCLPVKGK